MRMSPAAAEALDNIYALRIPDPFDPSKVIRQAANFFQLAPKKKRLEAILDRVLTAIDMDLLSSTNSRIIKATRLESTPGGRDRQETTSVKKLREGAALPKYRSIRILGRFPTRRFVPDWRQCYRCLRFGHIARACVAESPRCNHCSRPHESRVCWEKRRAKAAMLECRCANCQGRHVASSSWCPKCQAIASTLSATTPALPRPSPSPQRKTVKDFPSMEPKQVSTHSRNQWVPRLVRGPSPSSRPQRLAAR